MFIPYIIFYVFKIPDLYVISSYFLNLNINSPNNFLSFNDGAFWQVITAMFMHGGIGHILFNMYGLYIFGKPLEVKWGKSGFIAFYLTAGILANLASALVFIYVYAKFPDSNAWSIRSSLCGITGIWRILS